MSLLYNAIVVFISILSVRDCSTRGQWSDRYSHAVNDCFHLCFGIEACIDDCQLVYSSNRGRRRGRVRQRDEYEEYDNDQDNFNPIRNFGGEVLKEAVSSQNTAKNKNIVNFSITKLSQPKHCGLRYKEERLKRRSKKGARGMGRIIGGSDADPHEFPWLVSLQYEISSTNIQHFCGASIISEYYVLTAGHCTRNMLGKEDKIIIKAGINGLKEEAQNLYPEKIIVHDGWNADKQQNDISLIRLKKPVRFTTNNLGQYMVNAVCLPPDSSEPKGFAQLAGWGQLNDDEENGTSSEWLQKITLPIWNRNKCRVSYKEYMTIKNMHICAGGRGGEDSCMGDSGGPLTQTKGYRSYQIGLVSFGIPCAIKGLPGVYSFMVYFMDWIKNNMI